MYFGNLMFFEESFNLVTEPNVNDKLEPTNRLRLDTIIFNTFILMNLFNQINCRIVDSDDKSEMNIFKGLFTHLTFIAVLGGEFFVQYMII